MMAVTKPPSIAEMLGIPPDALEWEIQSRRPDDPQKVQQLHEKEMLVLCLTGWLSGAALLLALALCWLFLHYGKPEQAEKVVATIIGLVGGIGLGRTTFSKQ